MGNILYLFENQVAWNIPFDASAAEMTAALDELQTLEVYVFQLIKVENLRYGQRYSMDGYVQFAIHPTTYGDLPMLVWDESNSYLSYKDDGHLDHKCLFANK